MPKKFATVEERRAYWRDLYHSSGGEYKNKITARKKKTYQESSQFIWDYLKEHPCVDCGESDPIVLEFDHVHDQKFKAISDMIQNSFSLSKIKEEIVKCEVRCANCHRKKTATQLNWYKDIIK